jgi:threonine synthase
LLAQVVYYFAGYIQATEVAPTLGTAVSSLPPEGAAPSRGSPSTEVAPTLGTAVSSLPPEGAAPSRGGQKVSFAVPSGNFGNVCAGHVARMMGLPIDKLVVATNENDVLDEFFRTGTYRVRAAADTHETSSPSMDISKASNFERFVFDLVGRDGARTQALFGNAVPKLGYFQLEADPLFAQAATRFGFASGKSTHADRLQTIRDTWARHGLMVDPHTADGLKVAREHCTAGVPMVVLETALPIKFASTMVEALGREPQRPAKFDGIEALPKRVLEMEADVGAVKALIAKVCQR